MMDDVVAYIDAIHGDRRPLFDRVHRLVMDVQPDAQVILSYKMPTYVAGARQLHVGAGLAAARARGRVGGRPSVWTADKLRTAHVMRESGEHDVAGIAHVLGVSRASVYRALGAG